MTGIVTNVEGAVRTPVGQPAWLVQLDYVDGKDVRRGQFCWGYNVPGAPAPLLPAPQIGEEILIPN